MNGWVFIAAALLVVTSQSWTVRATTSMGTCGDGIRQSTEQCDEGSANGAPGSGCSFSCTINPGCYCNAPAGKVSTCTCTSNDNSLYLLLGLLGLLCCLLPLLALAALALGGDGYGGYGGYGYGGYGGYGGWRGLRAKIFGKAAPKPNVDLTSDAFVPAVVVPTQAPELPMHEIDSHNTSHNRLILSPTAIAAESTV